MDGFSKIELAQEQENLQRATDASRTSVDGAALDGVGAVVDLAATIGDAVGNAASSAGDVIGGLGGGIGEIFSSLS
jgi:hypothetical protein